VQCPASAHQVRALCFVERSLLHCSTHRRRKVAEQAVLCLSCKRCPAWARRVCAVCFVERSLLRCSTTLGARWRSEIRSVYPWRKAAEQAPLCKAHGARQRSKLRSARLTAQGSGASSALQGSRRKTAEQAPLYKAHGARRRSELRSTRLTAQDGGASLALRSPRPKAAEPAPLYKASGRRKKTPPEGGAFTTFTM